MKSLEERKALVARIPWVKKLREPVACDGIKWSTVALRDLYGTRTTEARGIQDRSRCKKRASWHFRPLKRSDAREGNYCWSHLIYQGLFCDQDEMDRTDKWFARHA